MALANKLGRFILKELSDESYSVVQYLYRLRRFPNFRDPKTFNEKIQWIKLHLRDPLMVQCADKFLVRDYVRRVLGENMLIPLLGVYDKPEQIPYETLPDRFVLKATHGSGWTLLCRDKSKFDRSFAAQKLTKWLQTNFYDIGREWAYRELKPRIVCEEFLTEDGSNPPPDYKVFCFHGEPKFIQVDYNRFTAHTRNIYDLDWNLLPCRFEYPNEKTLHEPPKILRELITTARHLSSEFPFVRVDLYVVHDRIFFGELTFYPEKGVGRFYPRDYDLHFGSYLDMAKLRSHKTAAKTPIH